jgi:hypothetical protein
MHTFVAPFRANVHFIESAIECNSFCYFENPFASQDRSTCLDHFSLVLIARSYWKVLWFVFSWRARIWLVQDHSKWGISTDAAAAPNIVCIGDINRMTSQRKRGGGAVCILASNLWTALNTAITAHNSC